MTTSLQLARCTLHHVFFHVHIHVYVHVHVYVYVHVHVYVYVYVYSMSMSMSMSMCKPMPTSMRHVQVYCPSWMFMSTLDVHVFLMHVHAAWMRILESGHRNGRGHGYGLERGHGH